MVVKETRKIQSVIQTILGRIFVFPLSNIVKRDKSLWVFGSNFGYADNPKYLYEEVLRNYPNIKAIWIYKNSGATSWYKSNGIKAFYYKSIKGVYYCMKAAVYVYSFRTSDINYYTSGNAFKVNLWHGIGMKEVEFRIKKGLIANRYNGSLISRLHYPVLYQKPDILLNVGVKYFNKLRDSFQVNNENCVVDIYPRCKFFYESRDQQINRIQNEGGELKKMYDKIKDYSKVYLYMPTFRDSSRDIFTSSGFDFEMLNEALKKSNDFFVIKVHPNTFGLLTKLKDYSNILITRHQFDIYPLLPFVDVLITDYSSIYFDFLLLKKEIILFPFDYQEYQKGDRELSMDYDVDIIGKKTYSFKELIKIIDKREDCHLSNDEYKKMIHDYWGERHQNIVDEIIKRTIG